MFGFITGGSGFTLLTKLSLLGIFKIGDMGCEGVIFGSCRLEVVVAVIC